MTLTPLLELTYLPLLHRRQIGAYAFEYFRRHADGFRERRVRMNGLANVDRIAAHLNRKAHFADQVARMRAHDAAAKEPMVALVEQKLGEAFVAAIGNGAS